MIRKLLMVALFFVLLATFGCEIQSDRTEDGRLILTIWQTYNNEELEVFEELIADYEALNPHIKIKSQRMPHNGSEPKVLTALATRTTPDIARLDGSFVAKLAVRNALIDVGPLGIDSIKDEYLPAALGSCLIKGKMYAVPEQINGVCLFYDKDRFIEVGLDPEQPPRTWEEFVEMGKILTEPEKTKWAFGMRNSLWWSFPFFNTYGCPFLSEDTKHCVLNRPEGVAAFEFQVSLFQEHGIEGGAWRSGGVRDDMGFPERYAMVFSGPWAIKGLQDRKVNFGVGLIPAGPAGTSTNVGGQNMVVFRTSKHQQEAVNFLIWLSSADTQAKWCNALGQIPVNFEAFPRVDRAKYPEISIFMEQMKTAVPRPQIMNYSDIENIFISEIEAALTGSKTPRQALDDGCRRSEFYLMEE